MLDEGIFVLLSGLLQSVLSGFWLTALPAAIARAISSVVNFYMNKALVFHSKGNTTRAFLRYFALAIPQALAHMGITYGLFLLFGIGEDETLLRGVIYALVMTALFFVSFVIQQRWVFSSNDQEK